MERDDVLTIDVWNIDVRKVDVVEIDLPDQTLWKSTIQISRISTGNLASVDLPAVDLAAGSYYPQYSPFKLTPNVPVRGQKKLASLLILRKWDSFDCHMFSYEVRGPWRYSRVPLTSIEVI